MRHLFLLLTCLCISLILSAQANFNNMLECDGVRCLTDVNNSLVAYYAPASLFLAVDEASKPDFTFIKIRYTGSVAYDDSGEHRFMSMLRCKIKMHHYSKEQLDKAKKMLWPKGGGTLRALPIADIQSILVFTAINEDQEENEDIVLLDGSLSSENAKNPGKGTYWKEREFTLKLDVHSSQALESALGKGQTLLSLSYAILSKGVKSMNQSDLITEGESKVLDELKKHLEANKDSLKQEQICVRSDVISINIDTVRWPELIRKIDINEEVPPGYAALEVRCYDFNNELRPDLFAKKVEVKATGVGRGDVVVKVSFNRKNADLYVHQIKFPYAVRLDKPLQYRVTSIGDEIGVEKSEWISQTNWTGLIDVTSDIDDEIVGSNDLD